VLLTSLRGSGAVPWRRKDDGGGFDGGGGELELGFAGRGARGVGVSGRASREAAAA
jgi:hypothetical protein